MSISATGHGSGQPTAPSGAANAGGSAPASAPSTATARGGQPPPGPKDSVQISDAAKAAAAALNAPGPASDASTARAKLDALYKAATADGTFITFDTAKGGRALDMSQLSDNELAAIAVDHGGSFSQGESDDAAGWLNLRLAKTLQPFQAAAMSGDRRGHAMTLNALYDNASDDVRRALNWTPAMRRASAAMLDGDTALFGGLGWSSILGDLRTLSTQGGMTFNG